MSDSKTNRKADIRADDRGENIGLMEPLRLSERSKNREQILDLVLELAQKSAGLTHSLPEKFLSPLAHLIRSMNCYYSNLIEGHDTHPVDIERALQRDFSADPDKRNLQWEARAHIRVQLWIDEGGLGNQVLSGGAICEIHRRFCENLPDALLTIENPMNQKPVKLVAGAWRRQDVEVGRHVAVSAGAVPRFMKRFEEVYKNLGKMESIIAAATAHHRLLWIHPFMDGNGRVARLMSHAVLLDTLNTGAIWSVARGLARNVENYKNHLMACDAPRRNDLDGRGNLSEEALAAFTLFFLRICIDQVDFMDSLIQPEILRTRIQKWAEEEMRLNALPTHAGKVLDAILYRGALHRDEIKTIVGTGERQARRIVSELIKQGVVSASTNRAPLHIAFPARLAHLWMPNLFPEKVES